MLTLAIPNRNGARFLSQTLESLELNRPHVRWWFQDSCSTDNSVEIATRFRGPLDNIRVERDKSQPNGLNRAFREMGGDIVGFLNSDDCLAEGAAEAVLKTFDAHPEVDIVYGEVEWIDENGISQGFHQGRISSFPEIVDVYHVWWKQRQWVQPEVFWRRSLWERVGPLSEEFDLAFDYEYWVRCFRANARVMRIPRVLAKFRRHAAQKSSASQKAAAEIKKIVGRALNSDDPLPLAHRWSLRNRLSYDLYRNDASSPNGAFWQALLTHPAWLALPEVRSRLKKSRHFSMGTPS